MPVHRIGRSLPTNAFPLRTTLADEWGTPSDKPGAPEIFEIDPDDGTAIEIYVVWQNWAGIIPSLRSEIILDAFESVRGKHKVPYVTIAMGLTPDEAPRFLPNDVGMGGIQP